MNEFNLTTITQISKNKSQLLLNLSEIAPEDQKLLQETNYTLQTIGEMVGYSEGNNFQASFKVVTGMTPGAFRRRMGEL